ncbi:queuosine-tRNA galactosyltransferase-like [Rhinophrynus dorsalis]
MEEMMKRNVPDVAIILPMYNAEAWLDECLKSVLEQDFDGSMELSIYNDGSKDGSAQIIEAWRARLEERGIRVIVGGHDSLQPHGVGFAKNQAILQSCGRHLCFLDADDVMMSQRVRKQYEAAVQHPQSIIGCRVTREPANATERYTRWINGLTPGQLLTQEWKSIASWRLRAPELWNMNTHMHCFLSYPECGLHIECTPDYRL